MRGLPWEAGQLLVGIVLGVTVLVGVEHAGTQPVGRVVSDVEEEGLLVRLLEEVERVIRDGVCVVPFLGVDFALPDGFVVVEPGGVPLRLGEPV